MITLLLVQLAAAPGDQVPTFGAEVQAVYVDVFVTSQGIPVTNLTAREFTLSDNGVSQEVSVVDRQAAGLTVLMALDTSSSMAGDKLRDLKVAGCALLQGLADEDEAGLVSFANGVTLHQPPKLEPRSLCAALESLRAQGNTSLFDALYLCLKRTWGQRRLALVVFSDGADTMSWLHASEVMAAVRQSSAVVHAVILGTPSSRDAQVPLLGQITELSGGTYWEAESGRSLESVFVAIARTTQARYVLRYEVSGTPRQGTHRLKVGVKGRKLDVRARREYFVP